MFSARVAPSLRVYLPGKTPFPFLNSRPLIPARIATGDLSDYQISLPDVKKKTRSTSDDNDQHLIGFVRVPPPTSSSSGGQMSLRLVKTNQPAKSSHLPRMKWKGDKSLQKGLRYCGNFAPVVVGGGSHILNNVRENLITPSYGNTISSKND